MLINKGMDADLETGLRLEMYGWELCFAHEDEVRIFEYGEEIKSVFKLAT